MERSPLKVGARLAIDLEKSIEMTTELQRLALVDGVIQLRQLLEDRAVVKGQAQHRTGNNQNANWSARLLQFSMKAGELTVPVLPVNAIEHEYPRGFVTGAS